MAEAVWIGVTDEEPTLSTEGVIIFFRRQQPPNRKFGVRKGGVGVMDQFELRTLRLATKTRAAQPLRLAGRPVRSPARP